jgi:osmotically inducible lipoprotein OsmB
MQSALAARQGDDGVIRNHGAHVGICQSPPVCSRAEHQAHWNRSIFASSFLHKSVMKSISKSLFTSIAIVSVALTSGCANLSTHDRNTITGAGVGAVAGAILTGGSDVGTVGGAAIGGYIGNQVRR